MRPRRSAAWVLEPHSRSASSIMRRLSASTASLSVWTAGACAARADDPLREVGGAQRLPVVGERHRALQLVLQLAHVARPRIGAQEAEGLGAHRRHRAPGVAAGLAEEVLGERGHVLGPLAQRAAGGSGTR